MNVTAVRPDYIVVTWCCGIVHTVPTVSPCGVGCVVLVHREIPHCPCVSSPQPAVL